MANLTSLDWVSNSSRKAKNNNYLCVITCNERNISIEASLPQEFSMDIGANYEEAFSQGLSGLLQGGGAIGEASGKALKMLGLQLTTKALTAQVWQGSTEVSFSLPLIFQVENNPRQDVQGPLQDLYSLTLPRESTPGGLLEAPGPKVDLERLSKSMSGVTVNSIVKDTAGVYQKLQSATSIADGFNKGKDIANQALTPFSNAFIGSIKDNISLSIGTRMLFKSVVITSVNQNFKVQPLEDGSFQRVEATVGFKTFYVLTQADMPDLFGTQSFSTDRQEAAQPGFRRGQ